MTNAYPKVSVVMSVYNDSLYVTEAVESILNQTFTDFEFIIINDASTDGSRKILCKYAEQDERIRLIDNKINLGLTKSLNKGVKEARGKYIARTDADDISYAHRLALQVKYMESNESVALISTYAQYIDASGKKMFVHYLPEDPKMLKWELIFRNPIRHSTVMWRASLVASQVGEYNPQYIYTQDYELWSRISRKLQIATLPSITVAIRHHDKSITLTKLNEQDRLVTSVTVNEAGHYLQKELTESQAEMLRLMYRNKHSVQQEKFNKLSPQQFNDAIQLYLNVGKSFMRQELMDAPASKDKLVREIQLDLVELLSFATRKKWIRQIISIINYSLLTNPVSIHTFILFYFKRLPQYRMWNYIKQKIKLKVQVVNSKGEK